MVNMRQHIQTTVLAILLLLAGGVMNEAWAKVTYHILTKPFTVKTWDGSGNFHTNIRVEALQCTSDETTVGLPDQFKSPLATNFQYWGTATSSYGKLYDSGNGSSKIITTKYYLYDCSGGDYACLSNKLAEGASVGAYTDIYVTYDYDSSNDILDINGGKSYNFGFTKDGKKKYVCYNRSRNNRVANALGSGLSGEELASDDFVVPANDKKQLGWYWSKWGPQGVLLGFEFTGEDPYNITITTSYKGKELHITDKITNVDNSGTVKPYAGSTLMSKVGATSMWFDVSNNKHYKISSGITDYNKWTPEKYAECWEKYYVTQKDAQYDTWNGFYRYESPTLNAFALLNHPKEGYIFVGSKMNQGDGNSTSPKIEQPSGNKYYSYYDNYDNDGGGRSQPYFKLQSLNDALSFNFNEIKTYTVHVKTHGSGTTLSATMRWSDAELNEAIVDHIPDTLRRKFVNYTAYSDAALTQSVSTFQDIQNADNGNNIYLKYTVSENLPFDTLRSNGDYRDARWYTIRMDGVSNPKYIAYDNGSRSLIVTDGSGNPKGSNTASQIHQGENSAEAMVAFIGDPYELKILNRKACEAAGAKKFIGCAAGSALNTGLSTDMTGTSDITTWEIVYESIGVTGILLKQYGSNYSSPKYIGLGSAATNKPVTYSGTECRIRVVELDKISYTYHIVRNAEGDIAVKASNSHDVGKALKSWTDIPAIIRSPFLSTATVTYYASLADAKAETNAITNAPYDYSTNDDIYVRYSVSIVGSTYNVRVNNNYIYTEGTAIKTKTQLEEGDASDGHFVWTFDFSDPYALTINNTGIDGDAKYVTVSQSDGASITWSETPTLFIAKSGALSKTYEVMLATGDDIDASTEYYNIGRPSENTVKLYSNSSYLSGNQTLRFQFSATTAVDVTYHLIDISGTDLLQSKTRQALTDNPAFPPEYYSPLVSKYYYHKTIEHARANRTSGDIADDAQILQDAVYVTYDVNDLVDLKAGQLYLLKYEAGDTFHQEDGSDGLNPVAQKAVYPYVNGDCNFFVYGQEQYELQQQGASSTRTRWAWYVESNVEGAPKGDPYHVTIKSRQTESYPITNSSEYNAYFMTYKPDGYSEVVTTLGWPGMNSETATEYMVLGSEGQYQLVTSNEISGSRYVVNSFEQYWKTWDTIRKKVYGESAKENDSDPITIPLDTKAKYGSTTATLLRDSLQNTLGWHSYEKWAYAKRWNGYNNGYSSQEGTHEKKKGWEKIEHWYQTVNMGEGYFDFVKTDINPVLILLDQHGWEIMRKPIPTSPDDPNKDAKYAEIRPYNSPMVKEYAFWATAKKRTGFHQYYTLSDRIGGDDYTSTDLTSLPPYGSKNVKDKKGNLNDQYVTYIVKDEYAQTYTPSTDTGKPFLIEQGDHKYATTNAEGTTLTASNIPQGGDMNAHILNDNIPNTEKWYIKPNTRIDIEMGYNNAVHTWTKKKDDGSWDNKNPNAYDYYLFKDTLVASYLSASTHTKGAIDSLGYFSFSNGFDPYNIQISSVSASTKFIKTDANNATLEEGSLIGSYPAIPGTIDIGDTTSVITPKPKWYDSRELEITNATYMAVQDEDGNMQLMPRFDHSTRMAEFGTLIAPTDDNVAKTYTKLYRPEVYTYLIIDNSGHESLRYKSGGDMLPQTPDHFKSPLATNFTYYANATYNSGAKTYSDITDEIEGSLDGATLTNDMVYVRYEYDEEADNLNILKGNWLTMSIADKYKQYDATGDPGIKNGTKDATQNEWQWKFLKNPQSNPDPYAVQFFNRDQKDKPMTTHDTYLVADDANPIVEYFAILSHPNGDYALTSARQGLLTYTFVNGNTGRAKVDNENDFTSTSGTLSNKVRVILTDEVEHTFTYKVYTNDGVNAIDASQTQETVISNDWKPELPEAARTPLLNMDQYRYYEAITDTIGKSLSVLYGLYDDLVYTRYTAYNPNVTNYMVPNVRNATSETTVARGVGSNDAPVGLDGNRPYNIIWYQDNMMKSNGTAIEDEADQDLQATPAMEWEFEGDDPYAIKIKSVGETGKYIHEATSTTTNLAAEATTFMLLNRDGYDYGVFAKTGDATTMLSGYGNALTTSAPNHFIPFALSTYKVIYHLMIKNIGEDVRIPYRGTETGDVLVNSYRIKGGTTLRDLESRDPSVGTHVNGDKYQLGSTLRDSTYCVDAGHVSLGDAFAIPQAFYRPNVSYDFYIGGVYDKSYNPDDTMNAAYKGLKLTNMGEDNGLLDKIVWVNVVYNFMGGLDTNSGSDFVESVSQNKWYTFETSGATPRLTQYTTLEGLKTKSGYATHYTNDYLWTPVGDPYGFKMYNRYLHKNIGGTAKVMSTRDFTTDRAVEMVNDSITKPYLPENSVYELLANNLTTPGYFRVHPVVNMRDVTQFYIKNDGENLKLNTTPTEWTFSLSEDLMRPYYESAGYVGGLNAAGKTAYEEALDVEGDLARLMAIQNVVYNHDNDGSDSEHPNYIVHYAPGYYRLHSQPGSESISTPRYMSGYTHKTEGDVNGDGDEADAIPMHFYEVEKYDVNNPTFKDLGTAGTDYTETPATRGDIPLVTVDEDPASIFYFAGAAAASPSSTMQTQGLYVKENKMTATEGNATSFNITDIGAGIVILYSGSPANYLSYDQTTYKYNIKYGSAVPARTARWCMQPVQKGATAGSGEMALTVATKNGGDERYYTTFYAPFDALLIGANDTAYVVPTGKWPAMTTTPTTYALHPKKIGEYNTGTYAGNSKFIPAGTPVIIRTKNTSGEVKLALPTTTPSSPVSCVFTGQYLEQMLAQGSDYIFVFGRSYTHSDGFEYDAETGIVTPAGLEFDQGVGFYKNANTNRESSATKTMWTRNNKYVYGNKVYYRGEIAAFGSSLNLDFENTEYIPVLFDDQGVKDTDLLPDGTMRLTTSDGRAYDMQGRCVATEQEVNDGSWRSNVAPGVYIIKGKKVVVQ